LRLFYICAISGLQIGRSPLRNIVSEQSIPEGHKPLRVRLRIGSMADATQEKASHCDMDHRLGDINALYIIAHEAPPLNEPSEGSLDHPASRQYLEALFPLDTPDNFDDELQECGLVHELGAIVGPVSEEMLDPT